MPLPVSASLLERLSRKNRTSAMAHMHVAKHGEGAGCWLGWEGNEHSNSTTLEMTATPEGCEVMVCRLLPSPSEGRCALRSHLSGGLSTQQTPEGIGTFPS